MATKQCLTCGAVLELQTTHFCPALSPHDAVRAVFESLQPKPITRDSAEDREATVAGACEEESSLTKPTRPEPPSAVHDVPATTPAVHGHDGVLPRTGRGAPTAASPSGVTEEVPAAAPEGAAGGGPAVGGCRCRGKVDHTVGAAASRRVVVLATLALGGALALMFTVGGYCGDGSPDRDKPASPAPTEAAVSPAPGKAGESGSGEDGQGEQQRASRRQS